MKIGILTYHAACNFGANLQALSTVCYWKNRGLEPIFINWMTKELEKRYFNNTPYLQFEEHKAFREKYFPMTERCYTDRDIVNVIESEKIDAIVVGSDAVMQTAPFLSRLMKPSWHHPLPITFPTKDTIIPNPFWGSFISLLKRPIPICYMSASSQNSPYYKSTALEKRKQAALLQKFVYISTRDDWTSKMVEYFTDGRIIPPVTPDPVFAFNYNVNNQPSKQEILHKFNLPENYSLIAFHADCPVSMQWLAELKEKMARKDVDCVAFPFPQGIEFKNPFNKKIDLPLSPLDWYALIKYSHSYIGDNMHPIVISLHNAVPCFSFDHYGLGIDEKSSKVYHIMNKFDLLENRVAFKYNYVEPSVDFVISQLERFDKEKVQEKSNELLNDYLTMMKDIAVSLKI